MNVIPNIKLLCLLYLGSLVWEIYRACLLARAQTDSRHMPVYPARIHGLMQGHLPTIVAASAKELA